MIKVAIIGCGKIAQVRHLPEYAANPNVELVGYYDLNRERAEKVAAQYGGKVYDTYFDLLNNPAIDAVSIWASTSCAKSPWPSRWPSASPWSLPPSSTASTL